MVNLEDHVTVFYSVIFKVQLFISRQIKRNHVMHPDFGRLVAIGILSQIMLGFSIWFYVSFLIFFINKILFVK